METCNIQIPKHTQNNYTYMYLHMHTHVQLSYIEGAKSVLEIILRCIHVVSEPQKISVYSIVTSKFTCFLSMYIQGIASNIYTCRRALVY